MFFCKEKYKYSIDFYYNIHNHSHHMTYTAPVN